MIHPTFTVELNVRDVNTGIELPSHVWTGECSTALRAVRFAERTAMANHRRWSKRMQVKYGLTARQLQALTEDGLLTPPNLIEVSLKGYSYEHYFKEVVNHVKPDFWARLSNWHKPNDWWH